MRLSLMLSTALVTIASLVIGAATITLARARGSARSRPGKGTATASRLSKAQRQTLEELEKQGIRYFLDNQLSNGLILDRQTNSGAMNFDRAISTSSTGMGLIAIAIASAPEHQLISHEEAVRRVKNALTTALTLEQHHGLMAHFLDPKTLAILGSDKVSVIDSTWLIAGGLWAANYLDDAELKALADKLYNRVDWQYFSGNGKDGGTEPLVMGLNEKDDRLKAFYDRCNAEVAFMYLLAIGADNQPLPATVWTRLKPYYRKVNGVEIASGDLGLFVFQYSNGLFDFSKLQVPGQVDLSVEMKKGVKANFEACRVASKKFHTFDYFWGLSAGDGPGEKPGQDAYRAYSPLAQVDGTAHLTASLASVEVEPDLVFQNIRAAESGIIGGLHGRYGYSNVNLDRNWVSRDVVGIDIGAEVMALENELYDGRTRRVFESLPMIRQAVGRLNALKGK